MVVPVAVEGGPPLSICLLGNFKSDQRLLSVAAKLSPLITSAARQQVCSSFTYVCLVILFTPHHTCKHQISGLCRICPTDGSAIAANRLGMQRLLAACRRPMSAGTADSSLRLLWALCFAGTYRQTCCEWQGKWACFSKAIGAHRGQRCCVVYICRSLCCRADGVCTLVFCWLEFSVTTAESRTLFDRNGAMVSRMA